LGAELRKDLTRDPVPVTIFSVTQAAKTGATYWWDRIDDLFPRVARGRWRAFESACGLPEEYRRGQPTDQGPLRPLRQWVLAAYQGRWPRHLEDALRALEEEAGFRTAHRSMTWEELASLAAVPGVEVGVHTMSHPVLPLLSDADLQREIAGAHADLRERLASVLPVLAVPFGLYDARTLRAAREAGMTASCTVAGMTLGSRNPPHALPRFCVSRGETAARLGLRLLGMLERMRRRGGRDHALYPDLPSATT
jgi:peptidoglycan/xylan/chitin deacetylase (PgdA/CDA1 family)